MQEMKAHTERIQWKYRSWTRKCNVTTSVWWNSLFTQQNYNSAAQKKHGLLEKQLFKLCVGHILPCRPHNTKHHNQQYSKRCMAIQTLKIVKVKSGTRLTFKRSPCAFSQQIHNRNRGVGEEREES